MIETISDFKYIIEEIKSDIKKAKFEIIKNANKELLDLYIRLGKRIDDNSKYGNNFINELSLELKLEFPNTKGFSIKNLSRMRVFYKEYGSIQNLPWTHNYILLEEVKDIDKRIWYAEKCYANGMWTLKIYF